MSRGIVALIGIAVLAVVGCGGDGGGGAEDGRLTKQQYEERIQALDKKLGVTATEFGVVLGSLASEPAKADLAKVASVTKAFQATAGTAVDEYETIEPPEEVDDLHRRLTDGTRTFITDLDELRKRAEAGEREEAVAEATKVRTGDLDSIRDLAEVTRQFIEKGYDLKS